MSYGFADAHQTFERLPGPGTLQRAVTQLLKAGESEADVRRWAVSISQEYGVWPYVNQNFENHIMGVGRRLAQHGDVA